jgi:hypothetical protein
MEPIVITLKENLDKNPQDFYDILNETAKRLVSPNLRQYFANEENRTKLLEEHGEQAYLLASKTKFPVINPFTGKFCNPLIEAARIRAFINDYPTVFKEAECLCNKVGCEEMVIFMFENGEHEYGLFDILEHFQVNLNEVETDDKNSSEYKELFSRLLQKYGVDEITDMDDETKKKFFNELDSKWKSDKEKEKSETYTENFDRTLKSFNVSSINELDTSTRKRFITLVESKW